MIKAESVSAEEAGMAVPADAAGMSVPADAAGAAVSADEAGAAVSEDEAGVAVSADEAGVVVAGDGSETAVFSEDGTPVKKTVKAADVTCKAQDSYEYPFLGLKLSLSKELLKQIKDQSIAMLTTEDFENQTNAVTYAYVSWSKMTEEQKNAEIQKMGTGYDDWVAGLDRIGTIGVYDEASQKKLDEITGCTEHKELGSSSDGKYKYYLSTNKDADEKLTKELEKIKTDITEMTPYQKYFRV